MSGFSAEWLALREPPDHAARSNEILLSWLIPSLPARRPLRILDLASGTGSNLRYLAPHLGAAQSWTLTDHDSSLLAAVPRCLEKWAQDRAVDFQWHGETLRLLGASIECNVVRSQLDLSSHLASIEFQEFDLVTSSALLDLVSGTWLTSLARHCQEARTAVLFALSYNGQMAFEPGWPGDTKVCELFNQHQRTDKGFGPALGPDAATLTHSLLESAGYDVMTEATDWVLTRYQPSLQAELIAGCAAAAAEVAPEHRDAIDAWHQQRLSYVAKGHSRIRVGHVDIAGRMPAS